MVIKFEQWIQAHGPFPIPYEAFGPTLCEIIERYAKDCIRMTLTGRSSEQEKREFDNEQS